MTDREGQPVWLTERTPSSPTELVLLRTECGTCHWKAPPVVVMAVAAPVVDLCLIAAHDAEAHGAGPADVRYSHPEVTAIDPESLVRDSQAAARAMIDHEDDDGDPGR